MLVDTAPELCPKGDIFFWKKDGSHFFMFWNTCFLYLVWLKCKILVLYCIEGSKSEGRAFWKLLTSETGLSPPVKYFYSPLQGGTSLVDHLCYFCAFASDHCCLVVTCWERADLLVLVCGVKLWDCYCPIWYPVSRVLLYCFYSWSLSPFLVSYCTHSATKSGCSGPVTGL